MLKPSDESIKKLGDRQLRMTMLDFAHRGDTVGRPASEIVKRAKAFEDYVKGSDAG